MKVSILDYKVGNITSIINMLNKFPNVDISLTNNPDIILKSDKLILPGVGAFGNAIDKIANYNLDEVINEYVKKGNSLLGICLGMQLLLTSSEEFGLHKGLSLIPGKVKKISESQNIILPNIGYYKIKFNKKSIFKKCYNFWYYFIHSFHCIPENNSHVESTITFNEMEIVSSISKENIRGCQFHPERSSDGGLEFYNSFLNE